MSRISSWAHGLVLTCGLALIGNVWFVVIPAYDAIALGPPAGTEMWFPGIARGALLARAGWLACLSTGACLWEAVRFRKPAGLVARIALVAALGGIVLNAWVWARHGAGMARALWWDVGHR